MSTAVFNKVLSDYAAAGGGALSLSPLTGELLLDPHLTTRLVAIKQHTEIGNVSFHTNGIAYSRLSEKTRFLLNEVLREVTFSIGGVSREAYRRMYGVDRFGEAFASLKDFLMDQERMHRSCWVRVVLNVDQPSSEILGSPFVHELTVLGVDELLIVNEFHNWGGAVKSSRLPPGAHLITVPSCKTSPCYVLYSAPMVLVDGTVIACGCADASGHSLVLGNCREQALHQIWRNSTYWKLHESFLSGSLPSICRDCSYYESASTFLSDHRLSSFRLGDSPWQLLRHDLE